MGLERVRYSAPGKVILCGEHFVVYGGKAIAGAIHLRAHALAEGRYDGIVAISSRDMRVDAEWLGRRMLKESREGAAERLRPLHELIIKLSELADGRGVHVEVASDIPRGVGLGSSAAVSIASAAAGAKALGITLTYSKLLELASLAEGMIHYKASGIDLAVAAKGGLLVYRPGEEPQRLTPFNSINLLIIDTGLPRRTGEMVRRVAMLRERRGKVFEKFQEAVEEIVSQMQSAIVRGEAEAIGELMTMNHSILRAIGVSTRELDLAVEKALYAGALGAKLTGGGGGGCVIALVDEDRVQRVKQRCSKNFKVYQTYISQEGVREEIEK